MTDADYDIYQARRNRQKRYKQEAARKSGRPPRLTQREAVLRAALTFGRPFTLAELVVLAWERHRDLFGLPGYKARHPSDSAVRVYLFGKRGLVARGLLRKAGDLYEVTP